MPKKSQSAVKTSVSEYNPVSLRNLSLVFLTGMAGVALALGLWWTWSSRQLQLRQNQTDRIQYGEFGYGRGISQQQSQAQGQANKNSSAQTGLTKQNCLMDGCLQVPDASYPVGELDDATREYLYTALADERKALATYQAIMAKLGNVTPFINIARAEEQHISLLKALFDKYGEEIPADDTKVGTVPATLAAACQLGVEAEIANDALYQEMLPNITLQDVHEVFTALATASREQHLPAFQRCGGR